MAFRKVLALALCATVALAAPAPQQLIQAQPVFHSAAPTLLHAASPVVRTVASAPTFHALRSSPVAVHSVAAPVAVHSVAAAPAVVEVRSQPEEIEVAASPNYNFGYSVADATTGDSKTRSEARDGDNVRGSYSVADPDGRIRVVEYTASKEGGFQATVTYDGEAGPPAIPFDAPAPAATVVAARNTLVHAAPAAVHTVAHAPAVAVRSNAIHAVHAAPAAVHTVAAAPAVAVRSNAVHAVHAAPAVHTVAAAPAVAVRSNAVHAVHAAPAFHSVAQPAAGVRLVNGQQFIPSFNTFGQAQVFHA